MKKKYILIIVFVIMILITLSNYFFVYIINPYINNHRFKVALTESLKIPDDHWDKKYQDMIIKDGYKVVIISHDGGEYNYAEFFKFSAEKLGWKVKVFYQQAIGHEKEILNFDPDFILFTSHANFDLDPKLKIHNSKKYILSLSPLYSSVKEVINIFPYFSLLPKYEKMILKSDGLLASAKEIDLYRFILEKKHKEFNGLRILPLAPMAINSPAEPKTIVWCGMGWDQFKSSNNLRASENYNNFIRLLGENIPIKIYGSYSIAYVAPHAYGGYIPSALEVVDVIRKNGIYLLTHSNGHLKSSVPSLRIFEAVAANAIVISDRHPFAIEHFGDNFLYFDQNADGQVMFEQVKAHYEWIKNNPEKAKEMASRAHQIFLSKFTLEKDLIRIAKMHEYIINQEKKMKLDYSLAY